jgi:hypothetical protein
MILRFLCALVTVIDGLLTTHPPVPYEQYVRRAS